MDCSFGQVCTGEAHARHPQAAKITVPVVVGDYPTLALTESGCSQMLVHQSLSLQVDPRLGMIRLQCIHSDIRPFLSAQVRLTVDGVT